jgi:hypothetical protein
MSYPRRRATPNEEKTETISKKTSEETCGEAVATEDFDLVDKEAYADARPIRLDNAH